MDAYVASWLPPDAEQRYEASRGRAIAPRVGLVAPSGTDVAADEITLLGPPAPVGLLGASRWQLGVKRIGDILLSVVMLVLLAPVMLLAALLIVTTSAGSPFFVQDRVGRGGRVFRFYKFRSMYRGSHLRLHEHLPDNEASGPVFKMRRDPRITPVGRVLRKFSIDELPQLWNVLRGDMSLVGPRPPLPSEVALYDWLQQRRLSVTPGLTCIWQVSGRSDVDFSRWLEMDLEYIRTWSLRLDAALLLRTVPTVVSGRGAY